MQQEKYKIYLARASHAEEQAAKTKDAGARAVLLQAAKEYRDAAKELKRQLPDGGVG